MPPPVLVCCLSSLFACSVPCVRTCLRAVLLFVVVCRLEATCLRAVLLFVLFFHKARIRYFCRCAVKLIETRGKAQMTDLSINKQTHRSILQVYLYTIQVYMPRHVLRYSGAKMRVKHALWVCTMRRWDVGTTQPSTAAQASWAYTHGEWTLAARIVVG